MALAVLLGVAVPTNQASAQTSSSPPYPTMTYPSRAAAMAACWGDMAWSIDHAIYAGNSAYKIVQQECVFWFDNALVPMQAWCLIHPNPGTTGCGGLEGAPYYLYLSFPLVQMCSPVSASCVPYQPTKNEGCGCDTAASRVSVGNPINVGTGNKYEAEEDAAYGDVSIARYYNSDNQVGASHMGQAWLNEYDRSISWSSTSNGSVAVVARQNGRELNFTKTNGVWVPDSDVPDTLTEIDDASGNVTGWTLYVAATGQYEDYSAYGQLVTLRAPGRTLATLAYTVGGELSAAGNPLPGALLRTITDATGRFTTLGYDDSLRIVSVTGPDGDITSYAYSSNNLLQMVTYPDHSTRQYLYDENAYSAAGAGMGKLTGITDESGARYATFTYNAGGLATSTQHGTGADLHTVSYASDGLSATVTYPTGVTSTLGFSNSIGTMKVSAVSAPCGSSCHQPYQGQTFDANGYPASRTDFNGNVTSTTYDSNGLLDVQVDASGSTNQRTTTTTWNPTLRVPLTRVVQDANNNTVSSTQWVYNAAGQILARCAIDPTNNAATGYTCSNTGTVPAGVRRWTYTYCTAVDTVQCPLVGLLLTATGPRTDLIQTTTYSYYMAASAVNCGTPGAACYQPGDLYQVTDALGHVTTIASYDADGRITRETDANGVNTDMTYTPRGWLASRTVGGAATTFTYTPYGAVQTVTDPDSVTTTYGYDAAHRLVTITDAQGNYVQYTLDAAGNKTAEQVYDSSGTVHHSLSRTFNTLGQLTTVVDGLNHTVFNAGASGSYDANGNLVQSSDALGTQRQQGYDALNRLVKTIDNYNGTDPATQNTQTQYQYDSLDRLTQVTDPSNLATTYSYDGLSDATGQVSPDTGTTARTYDGVGNVLTRTDANGITATNTYDALDRLASTSYADSTQNVAYHYDEANSVTGCGGSNPVGRLTRIVENAVTTVYCYDAQGNVIQKQQITAAATDTTGYSYTAANRLSGLTYPSGTQVSYARDGDGRIQGMTATPPGGTASTVVSGVAYQPFGPVSGYTLGNGQAVTRAYDANYRLTDLTSPAFNLHVARDAMGDITALGNAAGANPATETYSYDPLYRLTQITEANGSALESVTYNPTGDRTSKAGSGLATGNYSYNPNTHQLVATGSYARAVDADGNTTGITAASGNLGFGYNDRNRMAVAQVAGSIVASYTYDVLGERIGKTDGTTSETYSYDEGRQLLSEQGVTNRDYVWMDGIPVANVDTTGTTSSIAYVTADELGTPRAISDASGNTLWQWPYQGNAFEELAPTSSTGYVYNLRSPGQYFDVETGLSQNGFRDYDSGSGREIESDPKGLFGGQISTYAYGNNDPLSNIDPLGLQETTVDAYCARYGAAACAAAVGGNTGAGTGTGAGVSTGTGVSVLGGILTAIGANEAVNNNRCPDDECGPDTRFEAYMKALAWAGMSIGNEGTPIPWSQYSGRGGVNYTYVRQNGGSNYGYASPDSRARVMNHPDGHPDQTGEGFPDHHNCPHFHAVNARGEERIFPYKRGT
jgi:RHS repeat-associated protein